MSNNEKNSDRSMYDQQESKLSAQSAAFIQILTKRGILEDPDIDDEKIREAAKKKAQYVPQYPADASALPEYKLGVGVFSDPYRGRARSFHE